MRVLCICQKGNSRSVVMAWYLRNKRKHDTIATGMITASRRTRNMLYQWADLVILLAP